MAASGGGLPSPATVAGLSAQGVARARFPGRPSTVRSRLRSEKRTRRGRLGSDDGELAAGGPRPVNIGLALSEDPSLLRLLGVAEKHRRQRDAGFDSSDSEEEDFTGFGTTRVRPQKTSVTLLDSSLLSQAKSPQTSDHSLGAKPLIGKIIPRTPKPSIIGKIVPRLPKEGQDVKDRPVKDKDIPKVVVKLHGKQVDLPAKAKHADGQASGRQSSTRSADFNSKAGKSADSGSMQNQTAATSAGSTKQDKLVSPLAAVKGAGKASKVKEQGEPQRAVKRMKGFRIGNSRRTSQAIALSITSFRKRQRKRMAKNMGASPEAGAEAGAQSGEEAAMPFECKSVDSSEKTAQKRPRKSLFGHKRKQTSDVPILNRPKISRNRTRRVYYTYVPEPIPSTTTLQGQNVPPSEGETSSFSEVQQSANNSSTLVMSARSSRVIKVPKRFLDEEMIPFPKGSLSTWRKNQQREDGKPSPSGQESSYDDISLQSDSDYMSVVDSPSAGTKFSSKPNPGTSHLEIYKNLKKLTLKVAEKKKGQPDTQGDYIHPGDGLTSHVKKRRRSKLMMEEMDSPGVVRKLAVVVNTDVEAPSDALFTLSGTDEAGIVTGDSHEALEVSGPSYRIGLSGANKTMLHLLKKAKVQLIKIDQQKQLKLSQLGSRESRVPVSGRRRRRRRVGVCPKDIGPQQPLGGPRIKHVCRAAAVALGQPRAMVPDDIPRLSALPLHEREGITFSPTAEGTVHLHSDLLLFSVFVKPLSQYAPGGVRARRCGRCRGCLIEEDCAKCINCLDKPKFGGPNTKRQCCLSVLTSVPTTPQPVCLLCASKGRHEMIFCQICCEPFHSFCLSPEERPIKQNKENWCCRRCKFCHVCGRRSKNTKPVLQCRRCQTSYHPSCLGPTYPKPMNCSMPWVCMTCIRCKSCGVTPGKSWDLAWNHEQDLCPDCSLLHNKGNFCTVCHKCYDDNKKQAQMIQCSECSHWIHYTCEGLSDELFGLLSNQPEEVFFTCQPCGQHPTEHSSLKEKLQSRLMAGLEEVLTGLLSHYTTQHLLICKMVRATQEVQQPVCDLQAMEKKFNAGGYTSIKAFHADVTSLMRKRLKEEELLPDYQRPTSQARAHYVKLIEQVFSWFPAHHLKKWNSFSEEFPSGMLPEAVLPPSKEHSYAQWLERTYQPKDDVETTKAEDMRQCALCQQYGDYAPCDAGRLLYLGQNEWAHINCCLWSAEVYEENSALLQVHSAVSRGRHLRCDRCGQSGATVGCCLATCQSNFHFMCARAQNCVFQQDRKMYCYKHRDLVSVKMVSGKGFEVQRRVYVDFEGINLRRKFLTGLEPESINMTIGKNIWVLCSRLYWSTVDPRKRCKYTCKVTEVSTPLPGEEQDPRWDQEENHTIVHSPKSPDCLSSSSSPIKSTTPSPNSKQHNTPGSKSPGYTQTRRPAGGSSRPLPSPGTAPPKSHHILTLRDLEDTRRPRRLSSRSRCSSSPTDSDPSAPMTLRSGGTVHSRCALFSSPPRSSNLGAAAPLSRQNSTSPVWSSPPRSNSSISAGLSPRQGAITHSPKGRQNFRITTPVSAEVPQDFLASSEAEDAAEVAHLMAQELPYTVFDTDTEVAVASMLNAKLEFDEALLTENVAGVVQDVEMQEDNRENDSEDETSSHYFKFSRTVVCDAASSSDASGQLPSAQSISQLDGADGGSESDESGAVDNEAQDTEEEEEEEEEGEIKIHTNHNTPTKQLTVALKRLESIYTVSKTTVEQGTDEPDVQENSLPSDVLESGYVHDDMSVQGEEVLMSSETPTSPNEMFLDSATGHFVSAEDGAVVYQNKNEIDNKDESSSSTDSVGGFKDDLNDPDYSPEHETKKSPTAPMKTIIVKTKRPVSNLKRMSAKPCLPQQNKLKLLLPPRPTQSVNNASVSPTAAASFSTIPRTVTSPIVINGLNALPIQPGATRGRTVAIRLDNSKPASQQQVVIQNQGAATGSTPPPARQVLLVNRQGQILIKDQRTNTYQSLSTNSPAYNKISQIAKILHSGNAFQRSGPHVIIKPRSSTSATNVSPAGNHTTTSERKIIVRMVPVKSSGTPTPTAPVSVQSVPEPAFSNIEESTAQAIIDRAMATHRDTPKTEPIILRNTRRPKARHRRPSKVQDAEDSDQSPAARSESPNMQPTPASLHHQVRVKIVSPVSERPSRKKSKMDFLRDPSSDLDEDNEARYSTMLFFSSVMYRPSVCPSVLGQDTEPQISPPTHTQTNSHDMGQTHMWVSARHGDLSEWGPYSGFSSDDELPAPKHRKRTYMNQPHLRFEITSDDGFSVKANSMEVAWRAVIDGVLEARAGFHLKQLPLGGMSGPRVLGVVHDAVIFLLEQLQGAANCKCHRFRFHRCDYIEEELPLNPSGCARSEVYTRKATFDMFNFLASQHRELPDIVGPFDEEEDEFPLKSSRRATSSELPMAMRFRHLEKISKEAVGVYRSEIHGRGLFCKRNIEAGEMVIEYAGTVIRSVLTDKREKYYDGKGIGCYMFRIDDFDVVDATMQGNAARFINHSCEPNCYSRVINVDGRKHIVIFALRKIYRGEELTYDYKFPIEDENSKLHCNCGARRCRRFLN
uniref:[histone H3]-lysine(4) N-methyltransferase n=1 Tax=Dicentrarchus labrax TaxID=13489 RepID=A0A8C4F679_DICLA